jgi:hypothetical protein
LRRRNSTAHDLQPVDTLAIVPTEISNDSAAQFELLAVDEAGAAATAGYIATGPGSEIVDVALAIASVAWKPPRRGPKPEPPPLH